MPSSKKQKAGYVQHTNPFFPNADPPSPKILKVLWEMKKNGKAKATIKNVGKALKVLARSCNLDDPDSVKTFIAVLDRKNGYKRQLCYSYNCYVKVHGLQWKKPNYYVPSKMPKIPQESQIKCIIADSSKKLAVAIAMSKDTGLRPIELMRLKLKDIDLAKGAVYPETAKHGSPRVLKLHKSTLHLLHRYLSTSNIGINDRLFGCWSSNIYGRKFRKTRNRVAYKTGDESFKSIRLYDLRHFFATMTYHRTKDILFVKQQMGHKKIETTLIYTQLLQFEKDDNYTCKVAQNVEQATELIENGFEYVTEIDGLKLFRKRK
jgi:integrase